MKRRTCAKCGEGVCVSDDSGFGDARQMTIRFDGKLGRHLRSRFGWDASENPHTSRQFWDVEMRSKLALDAGLKLHTPPSEACREMPILAHHRIEQQMCELSEIHSNGILQLNLIVAEIRCS